MLDQPKKNSKKYLFSVVIPTLGGGALDETVSQLNRGTLTPEEILICIPEHDAFRVENMTYNNVSVVKTKCKGQVRQRIEGFRQAKCEYVVQLDDDIHVYENCFELLVESLIKLGNKVSVAPAFVFQSNQVSVYKSEIHKKLPKSVNYFIHGRNGLVPGRISRTGMNFGVDASMAVVDLIPVDWIPGGCAMHHKENLVLNDYYPFQGKAYSEDVIHSIMLKKKKVALYINKHAHCGLDNEGDKLSLKKLVKLPFIELRVRKLIVTHTSGNLFFMCLDMSSKWLIRLLFAVSKKLKIAQ